MLDKIKNNVVSILGLLLFILSGAFLYEKSRKESAEAIADNKADLDKVNEINKQISSNEGQLDSEEQKRKEIEKEAQDAKSSNDDSTDFLKRR